ncbi:MAG: alpha/beta fold hydrolase [Thermoanaerobaculia bacterium]
MRALTLLFGVLLLLTSCATAPHPTTIPVEGGSLFVDDGGRTGVPIVFIHGNGGNARQWRAQLAHFRGQGRRAVAIDLPGFGQSTAPANGDFSLNAMASAIDRVVDGLRLPRFVLVGHSYAGAVVATYAAAHPEKVAGVVYLDAAGAGLSLSADQQERFAGAIRANKMQVVRGWFAPMLKGSSPAVQEEVFASVEKTPTEVFVAALMSLTAYDAQKTVAAYTGPRLAIAATDVETPMSFHKQFPDVRTVAITGAGHWVMLDKPEEVNAAIDSFLLRRPSPTSSSLP